MAGELDMLMKQFTDRHRLSDPRRDEEGRYFLLFDGTLEVALFQTGERIYLEAPVVMLPTDKQEAELFLKKCLNKQLVRIPKGEGGLAMHPQEERLIFYRQISARFLAFLDFEQAIEHFVNGLEFWHIACGHAQNIQGPIPPFLLHRT